jgi:glycosyltransferase involved in cell wall biosynthesis
VPKILRIVNRFNLGGITYNVSYLSAFMGPEYETLLVGGPEEAHEKNSLYIPQQLGLNPLIISEMRRSLNPFKDVLAYYKLRQIIKSYKPDIVHTHASKAGFIGRLAARHEGVKHIVHTFHGHVFKGYFNALLTQLIIITERYLAKRSSVLIAISPTQAKDLGSLYKISKPEHIRVVRLGFDLNRFFSNEHYLRRQFRLQHSLKDTTLALGIIGRLAPIKQHHLLLDQLARIHQQTTRPYVVFIIGDGETGPALLNQLKVLHQKGQLPADGIRFLGWIETLENVIHGLDAVLLCSKNEGTPVSLIEAQAAGVSVISTNVGGVEDVVIQPLALLSDVNAPDTFGDHMLNFINNADKYIESAKACRHNISSTYSYTRLCHDMKQVYESLLHTTQ